MEILEAYDTRDAIPKEVAENYVEREDGKFVLKFVKGLKNALDKERTIVQSQSDKLKQKDVDAEAVTKKHEEDLAAAIAKNEGNVTSAVKKREAELQDEFTQREAEIRKGATKNANKAEARSIAAKALQKAGGNITHLEDRVAARIAFDENGKAYVVSEDGTPELDQAGNHQSIDGLVDSFRADPVNKMLFKGAGGSGGGMGGEGGDGLLNGDAGDGGLPLSTKDWTPRQKIDFINEHGNEAFMDRV